MMTPVVMMMMAMKMMVAMTRYLHQGFLIRIPGHDGGGITLKDNDGDGDDHGNDGKTRKLRVIVIPIIMKVPVSTKMMRGSSLTRFRLFCQSNISRPIQLLGKTQDGMADFPLFTTRVQIIKNSCFPMN